MTGTNDNWPAGATWVFQGTVGEDATAGTHICSLTVTPGAGNEMEVVGFNIIDGNTATAQNVQSLVDDGTNNILPLQNPGAGTTTVALLQFPWPIAATSLAALTTSSVLPARGLIVSGTMRLILKVSTAAVSVTQTFSVVCRIKGAKPTATLADTVGTPTLTTNTNAVF